MQYTNNNTGAQHGLTPFVDFVGPEFVHRILCDAGHRCYRRLLKSL